MPVTQNTTPAITDELHSLVLLARRTAREWRSGAVTVLAGLLLTALVVAFWPRQYRSETVVYYREGLQWSAGEGGARNRRIGERFRDSLLARAVLTRVIEEMGLYRRLVEGGKIAEAVEEMRLAVEFKIEQGDVFVIAFKGDSPDEAQKVTAKLAEVLIGENARMTTEQARVAGEFLIGEKKRTEAELAAREAAVLQFLAKHPEFASEQGPLGGSLRTRAPTAGQAADEGALAALRREEERLRRQLNTPGSARSAQDPALVAAKEDAEAKLRAAQRDLAEKKGTFTEEHPDVRAAEAAVASAGEAFRRAQAALAATEPRVLEGRLSEIREEIATVRRLSGGPRPAAPDPSRNSEVARQIVANEAEWARLNREAAESRERFQQLENRQFVAAMTASMAASGQSSQIVVIDPAYRPAKSFGFSTSVRVVIGLLVSLFVAAIVTLGMALYQDRVLVSGDLERLKLGPVLLDVSRADLPFGAKRRVKGRKGAGKGGKGGGDAAAPAAPAKPPGTALAVAQDVAPALVRVHRPARAPVDDPRLIMVNAPESRAAAGFRVLTHRLRERGDPRTVLVTSSGREEGKSLCAVNLALALVEGERGKAVLLEAHHRAPSIAKLFGIDPPVGAAEQLEAHRAQSGQPWEVVETFEPRLHVLAMAQGGPRPTLDGRLGVFVAACRLAGYDWVIIDGPDALGSADVTLMQESVAGLLVVVRGETTRARTVRAAVERVGTSKLLGFTLLGSTGP